MNPLYRELRPGDTFTSCNSTEALWMVVGIVEIPEKDGWIRMSWTFLEEPQYGVYDEERLGSSRVESDWPLIQRGPL